ncbi:hypothetical protein GCM10011507_15360 [Edaphobacter acidisoli]|uniref:DUF5666 domain-containing protein n=2 Tax=Edaphobacter acidisoli TaxID=2040573 RepID=A0A916W4D4_9BACT|nr:DUF5666 domain-containing protein [Edaphobacter acidisoli]GGA64656.1 hypothetical protein GCM10011507_15360 [Edaphobacter acidisoli]
MLMKSGVFQISALGAGLLALAMAGSPAFSVRANAQSAAPASAMSRALGTVKSVNGNSVVVTESGSQEVTVTVPDGARILQLAPGSTNLKDAQPATLSSITVGDRVLVTGKAGDSAGTLTALRVILMKSAAIAQEHEAEEAEWQKNGIGGIVRAIDPSTGTLTISVGAKKVEVKTASATKFRRYAGDSVKFEDAVASTLDQIHPGDQLRVRGSKSEDGLSVQADEVVSGSFKNLSGLITTIDAADGTVTLKDLATKKVMRVKITPNSNVHTLPPQAAAMLAARARGGASAARGQGAARPEGAQAEGGMGERGAGRSAGADLSQIVSRLPQQTIADLKAGDAVMVVGSQADPGSSNVTAITVLAGVEPILRASPSGSSDMTLSPWSVGGGAPEMGAQQQ